MENKIYVPFRTCVNRMCERGMMSSFTSGISHPFYVGLVDEEKGKKMKKRMSE